MSGTVALFTEPARKGGVPPWAGDFRPAADANSIKNPVGKILTLEMPDGRSAKVLVQSQKGGTKSICSGPSGRGPGSLLIRRLVVISADSRRSLRRRTGQSLATLPNMYRTGLVNLYTRDIEAGLHFYRDLLGFVETFRTPTDGILEHVEFQLEGFKIGLGTVEAAKRAHGVDAAPGSPAMVLVIWADDVDCAYAKLVDAGVPVVQPPHDTGNNNRNALMRDPDGNLVEIVAKAS